MEDPSFAYSTIVSRKKRKGRIGHGGLPVLTDLVDRAKGDIESNGWMTTCLDIIQDALRETGISCPDVLCLGLGSPSASREARAQLAFLIRTCAVLGVGSVSLYDPVFTDADKEYIQGLGMHCLSDTDAKHIVQRPTILYMPHCDLELYENVIGANWSEEHLRRIVFIANRFSDYSDNNPRSKLEMESPFLMRLASHLQCHPLPTLEALSSAFNNLSVQYVGRIFPSSCLDPLFSQRR